MSEFETATLAGGCFWCIESIFKELKGVEKVVSGYCGGDVPNPTYEQVCSGKTGHAETVQITFNPKIISYADILEVFFSVHNPTSVNRQGPDTGNQYRSAIFYMNKKQKATAERVIKKLNGSSLFSKPIVTEVEHLKKFYKAEDYHQDYKKKNPENPYCMLVITPKLFKFRKKFSKMLKSNHS